MTAQIFYLMLILLISCGQAKKESPKEKSIIISSDSLTMPKEKQLGKSDKTTFHNLDSALLAPEKVIHLEETQNYREAKHLPLQIGLFVNLKTLQIACMEELEDLPFEIGQLKKLEKLIINNSNGCMMNISIPSSIGQLQNLKELVLYGAMDAFSYAHFKPDSTHTKVKKLPKEIGELKKLEILDLGRNGIDYFPPQIEYLTNLRSLELEYNRIKEIPSYISKLGNLEKINIRGNGRVILPNSLSEFKKLKMRMGDCELTLKDQAELRIRFPNIIFDFENEYIGGSNEQEKQ